MSEFLKKIEGYLKLENKNEKQKSEISVDLA
jgi:hypothetical protein